MKILLLYPPQGPRTVGGDDFFRNEPLALEYLAAGLLDHHDVEIRDLRFEPGLGPILGELKPDLVGITGYTAHVRVVQALFDEVKAWNPEVLTVVGGHHATVAPEDFLRPSVDLVVQGEGVKPLQEIVRRAEAGGPLRGIPNVIWVSGGEREASSRTPGCDESLDEAPLPARQLTARYRHGYFSDWMRPLTSIRTSKGCPFRCSFCALWKLTDGRYLTRATDRIVEEIAGLDEEWVFFADDESLVSAKRMLELAERIAAAGLKKRYFLYGRADTIVRHPELVERWCAIGLARVFVGFESFRDEDLKDYGKRTSVSLNEQAIGVLTANGLDVYASFIVRPDFTRDDFRAMRDYCRRLPLNYVTFSVLTPCPGTDLYAEVRDQLILHDPECVDFFHAFVMPTLGLRGFYDELARLYRTATPARRILSLLRKFPLREIPGYVSSSKRIFRKLRRVPEDYDPRYLV